MNFIRVTKKDPCRICNHPDWCGYTDNVMICMRVQSDHPSHNGGWIHYNQERRQMPARIDRPSPTINTTKLIFGWKGTTTGSDIQRLADKLNVKPSSLLDLEAQYAREYYAWAFPMSDGYGEYIGVRLRDESGVKWCVRGSRNGLFIPHRKPEKRVLICEGPTDTAAALSLGFFAIGRPSCSGGVDHVVTFCKRNGVREAVVVADDDEPGLRGADTLCEKLSLPTVIIVLPAKDMRDFVRRGGTGELIESIINQSVWDNK